MCTFSIPFSGNADALISKLSSGVTSNKGTFNGDASAGNFNVPTPVGAVAGTYTNNGSSITINISNKPFFLGCSQIEGYLKSYIGS